MTAEIHRLMPLLTAESLAAMCDEQLDRVIDRGATLAYEMAPAQDALLQTAYERRNARERYRSCSTDGCCHAATWRTHGHDYLTRYCDDCAAPLRTNPLAALVPLEVTL